MARVDVAAAQDLDGPSVFAYLSDLALLNEYGADAQLEGWIQGPDGNVRVIHSMPFYQGRYPSHEQIVRFHEQFDEIPGDTPNRFVLDNDEFDIDIWDAKPANYIDDQLLGVTPIDIHFMFDSREDRLRYMESRIRQSQGLSPGSAIEMLTGQQPEPFPNPQTLPLSRNSEAPKITTEEAWKRQLAQRGETRMGAGIDRGSNPQDTRVEDRTQKTEAGSVILDPDGKETTERMHRRKIKYGFYGWPWMDEINFLVGDGETLSNKVKTPDEEWNQALESAFDPYRDILEEMSIPILFNENNKLGVASYQHRIGGGHIEVSPGKLKEYVKGDLEAIGPID